MDIYEKRNELWKKYQTLPDDRRALVARLAFAFAFGYFQTSETVAAERFFENVQRGLDASMPEGPA